MILYTAQSGVRPTPRGGWRWGAYLIQYVTIDIKTDSKQSLESVYVFYYLFISLTSLSVSDAITFSSFVGMR